MANTRSTRARARWLTPVLWALVILLAAPLLWLGVRGFVAYDALMNAQARISDARANLLGQGPQSLGALVDELRDDTSLAASMMGDPIWMAVERAPVVGANLRVVREVTSILDEFVHSGLEEIVAESENLSLAVALPHDGRFDLERIDALWPLVERTLDRVRVTGVELEAIDLNGALGPVRSAVASATGQLQSLLSVADEGEESLEMLLVLLGSEGPQRYTVVVLDSLVDRPIGGAPAAAMTITLDRGVIHLGESAPLTDVLSDADVERLHGASAVPDFAAFNALAGELLSDDGALPTAVITLDTTGLLHLIGASGPVEIGAVERAALDIATRELVEVADPSDADRAATLAAVTHSVLRNVADGDGATRRYLDAASKLRLQGHLSMWSPSREVSELIALTALDRSVPSDNSVVTSYGGYLSQGSDASRASDVRVSVHLAGPRCVPSDPTLVTAEWVIDVEGAAAQYSFVGFAPHGGVVERVWINGAEAPLQTVAELSDRPVSMSSSVSLPAGQHTMIVEYRLTAAERGPQEYRTNARWTVTKLTLKAC